MIWEVNSKSQHDHIGIFNENNKRIVVSFDENKYKQHTVLIADSGSIFELILQEKSSDKLEAIRELTTKVSVYDSPSALIRVITGIVEVLDK